MGGWLAAAFTTYIFAMLLSSVASTLLIITVAPFLAAVIAWRWIGEIPRLVTWPTMTVATFGVGLMVYDGANLGYSLGNICAFISAFCFAVMLVVARRSRKIDVLGGTFMAGVFSILLGGFTALIFDGDLAISHSDILIILFMGAFTIGIGIAFVAWGAPYLPAPNVGVLVLIESVLAPIWVWLFLDMPMKYQEIIGGMIIFCAVLILSTSKK